MSASLHGASLDKPISLTAMWLSSQREREKKRGWDRGRSDGKEGVVLATVQHRIFASKC